MKTVANMRIDCGRVRLDPVRSVAYAIAFVLCSLVTSASAGEIETGILTSDGVATFR